MTSFDRPVHPQPQVVSLGGADTQWNAPIGLSAPGHIVFAAGRALPGFGLTRARWNGIIDQSEGPVERDLSCEAPFTKRNREQDYAMVWVVLDELSHTA